MERLTKEDKRKIAEYRAKLDGYARPSVTADIVAIRPAYSELKAEQWRENPEFSLEVLFIRRGQWPFEGSWALPGGFIRREETVDEGARRELREETALVAKRLIPVGVFSKPDRDMRAWIISNVFVSIHRLGEGTCIKGGDDAADAKWLRVKQPEVSRGSFRLPFFEGDRQVFSLTGTYREEDFGGGTVLHVDENPLAFDHGEIVAQTFLRILSFETKKLAFFFLPEKFTLGNYIEVCRYLGGESPEWSNIPNFRRQLTATKNPLLEVCEGEYEELDGRGHAPAKLYRRRIDNHA